jgi:hypothetical protein
MLPRELQDHAGWTNIKQATEKMNRRLDQVLTLLGV